MHTKSFSLPPSLPLPSFLRSIELYSLFFNDNLTYFRYGHLWNVNSVAVGTFTINRRNFQVRTPSKIVIFALQFWRQVKDGRTFFCQLFSEFHIYRNIFKESCELLWNLYFIQNIMFPSKMSIAIGIFVKKILSFLHFIKNLSSRFMLSTPKCLGKGRGSLEASR